MVEEEKLLLKILINGFNCSVALDVNRGLYQDGEATDCAEGNRAGGEPAAEGWVARVLRREARKVCWKAGEEASDLVYCRVPSGKDDA